MTAFRLVFRVAGLSREALTQSFPDEPSARSFALDGLQSRVLRLGAATGTVSLGLATPRDPLNRTSWLGSWEVAEGIEPIWSMWDPPVP